jgi:hypothetical protein
LPQLQFKMMCERPPAAFGGSPPHGACPSKEKKLVFACRAPEKKNKLGKTKKFFLSVLGSLAQCRC